MRGGSIFVALVFLVFVPVVLVVGITYTGGTTGKPKGVIGTASSIAAMTQIQLAEWEWPDRDAFQSAARSEEFMATGKDAMEMGGKFTVMFADVD